MNLELSHIVAAAVFYGGIVTIVLSWFSINAHILHNYESHLLSSATNHLLLHTHLSHATQNEVVNLVAVLTVIIKHGVGNCKYVQEWKISVLLCEAMSFMEPQFLGNHFT